MFVPINFHAEDKGQGGEGGGGWWQIIKKSPCTFIHAIYFSGFSTSHQSCALEALVSQGRRSSLALHHRPYHRPRDPRTSTLYSTCHPSTPPCTYRTRASLSSLTNNVAFGLSALLLCQSCRCCIIFAINYVKKVFLLNIC